MTTTNLWLGLRLCVTISLVACSAERLATKGPRPSADSALTVAEAEVGEDADRQAEGGVPELPDLSPRLVLLPKEPWNDEKTVCELDLGAPAPHTVLWRELPLRVHQGIRAGKIPDTLHAFADTHGINDVTVQGWG